MSRKSFFVALLSLLLLSGCNPWARRYDPASVNFQVVYNPVFENQFYPSAVLGLAHYVSDEVLNDSVALFKYSVTAPEDNSVLRVVVDSSMVNLATTEQYILPHVGERYTFYPQVKWKFDKLYRLRRQATADLTFTCYVNDEEVDLKNLRLNCRSANDCLLSIRDKKGRMHDFRWLFAGYVNEDHPYIDSILVTMLSQGVVTSITGYQGKPQEVGKQVEAIWYYALERGITYSSISCAANPTQRSNVQHIRFFDEVYDSRQANCIDACVFFASIMRKIGLKPLIFVEPCHAYLGYYTSRQRQQVQLLETTITGWVNFPSLTREYRDAASRRPDAAPYQCLSAQTNRKYCQYLSNAELQRWKSGQMSFEEFKHAVAHQLFLTATEYDTYNYQTNKAAFDDPENQRYQRLDIEQLRKIVRPIN